MADVRLGSATEFREFFRTLARRLRNETHLSDITYSAIEVIPEFKKDFVHYFFSDLNTDEDIEVRREFALPGNDGQPDLVFSGESWDLIVENKIWDENYHFDQYGKAPLYPQKPIPRVGLIANRHVGGVPQNWKFRQWAEFVDHFRNKDYGRYGALFEAYLTYVREICKVAEFKEFTLEPKALFALTHFARMAERTLHNASTRSYEVAIKSSHFGESWAGHWFELKPTGSKNTLTLFFGIDWSFEPGPAIVVEVLKRGNPKHFKLIEQTLLKSPSFQKVRREAGFFQLLMPTEAFNALNSQSKEKQLSTLRSFVGACCNALYKSIR
jgi:hypothetical protein